MHKDPRQHNPPKNVKAIFICSPHTHTHTHALADLPSETISLKTGSKAGEIQACKKTKCFFGQAGRQARVRGDLNRGLTACELNTRTCRVMTGEQEDCISCFQPSSASYCVFVYLHMCICVFLHFCIFNDRRTGRLHRLLPPFNIGLNASHCGWCEVELLLLKHFEACKALGGRELELIYEYWNGLKQPRVWETLLGGDRCYQHVLHIKTSFSLVSLSPFSPLLCVVPPVCRLFTLCVSFPCQSFPLYLVPGTHFPLSSIFYLVFVFVFEFLFPHKQISSFTASSAFDCQSSCVLQRSALSRSLLFWSVRSKLPIFYLFPPICNFTSVFPVHRPGSALDIRQGVH